MIYSYGERYQVRVFRSLVTGNEIHLLLKASFRKGLADFLRVLAGRVAISVSGAAKGIKKIGKFWNELCWSRILNWGAEFSQARTWFTQFAAPPAEREGEFSWAGKSAPESGFT